MTQDGKSQVSVKLPTSLYDQLVQAVINGKYPSQTAGIVQALENDLDSTLVNSLRETIQLQVMSIEEKDVVIQKLASDLSVAQATLEGHLSLYQEKDHRVADLQKQISVKDDQLTQLNEITQKQAVHIQSLIQENSKLNMKLLPENTENNKRWWKFW